MVDSIIVAMMNGFVKGLDYGLTGAAIVATVAMVVMGIKYADR